MIITLLNVKLISSTSKPSPEICIYNQKKNRKIWDKMGGYKVGGGWNDFISAFVLIINTNIALVRLFKCKIHD